MRAVLIIDNDPRSAKLLELVLHAPGREIRIATSAEEALEVLTHFTPEMILLELIQPAMSGPVLVERLRADPRWRRLLIIAVTSVNGTQGERIAREAGCDAYVRKPIDALTLLQTLREVRS